MTADKLKFMFASPEGRISRQTWWLGILILVAVNFVLWVLFGHTGLIALIMDLVLLLAGVMLHMKRCHDRGKSGLWVLLLIIPVIGLIWAIIDLGILEGDEGDNQYGPAPVD